MTKKDRIALAHTLADCLQRHSDVSERSGVLAARTAIADMLHDQSFGAFCEFEEAWRERMRREDILPAVNA